MSLPGSPLPARLRRQWRRPGHRLRLRPASCPHCDCGLTRGSQSDYAGAVPPRSRNLSKAERNELKGILGTVADEWRASARAKIAALETKVKA